MPRPLVFVRPILTCLPLLCALLALSGLSPLPGAARADTLYTVDVATDDLLTIDSGTGTVTPIYHFDRDLRSVDLALSADRTKLYATDYVGGVYMIILTITLSPGPISYTSVPVTLNGVTPNSLTTPPFPDFNCGGDQGQTFAEGLALVSGRLLIAFGMWTTNSPSNCASLSNMIGQINPVTGVIEPTTPAPFDLLSLKNPASPNCFDCPFGSTCTVELACRADVDGMTGLPDGHILLIDNINDGRWNSPSRVEFANVSLPPSPSFTEFLPAVLENAGSAANDVALSCDPASFFSNDSGVLRVHNLANGSITGTVTLTRQGSYHGLASVPCGQLIGNCPRTGGYWTQVCAQKAGGSTKFSVAAVTQIAECVDNAAIFDWAGTTDLASFCSTVNIPVVADQRKQAKRQFATFLANVCTGQLGLVASNGDKISLDTSTPINCAGLASTTLGGLIGEVDGRLIALEGQSLTNAAVKTEYSSLIACLDAINNGLGIGTVCPALGTVVRAGLSPAAAGRLFAEPPSPNPFSHDVSFVLAVGGVQSKPVDVRIFDVSGRLVRTIATGTQMPGRHSMRWDGTSDQNRRVPAGIYFLHTSVGEDAAVTRLMLLR